MTIEFKIITFWLFVTSLCYIIARVMYKTSRTNWKWKHYIEDVNCFGIAYMVLSRIGIAILAIYAFLSLAYWWFKL